MKLTTIDDFKGLVGETILALPTGNNRVRSKSDDEQPITKFVVVSVKRKYVELSQGDRNITDYYLPETGATQSEINSGYGLNGGYIFFRDEDSIHNYTEERAMKNDIQRFFSWRFDLSGEDIRKVWHIIKGSSSSSVK